MDTLEMPVADTTFPTNEAPALTSPRDRPPRALRIVVGSTGVGALLFTAALLLSDRAPGVVESVFGERVRELWERIDTSERVDLPPTSELPSTDFLVHVAIWAVVAGLVGLAVWTWRGLAVSAVLLGAASVGVELAQGRFATTRAVEGSDAAANLLGIGLGVTAAAACLLVWSALAGVGRLLGAPTRGGAGSVAPDEFR